MSLAFSGSVFKVNGGTEKYHIQRPKLNDIKENLHADLVSSYLNSSLVSLGSWGTP